jgi:UDP-glucuronate decarboxylase
MKQLHKQSVNHRREEENPLWLSSTPPYSPKTFKHPRSLPRSLSYLLKEQRLLFILVGILIGSTFFILQPTLYRLGPSEPNSSSSSSISIPRFSTSLAYQDQASATYPRTHAKVGRVPAGIGRRRSRIVVTGGAGFVGSHLVDKLLDRGDDVIVIDNFFTGRKENLVHRFGDPRFELIRHDVVEPILLEADQIYHLACPASPVHYKYNPVKTIISFSNFFTVVLIFL